MQGFDSPLSRFHYFCSFPSLPARCIALHNAQRDGRVWVVRCWRGWVVGWLGRLGGWAELWSYWEYLSRMHILYSPERVQRRGRPGAVKA